MAKIVSSQSVSQFIGNERFSVCVCVFVFVLGVIPNCAIHSIAKMQIGITYRMYNVLAYLLNATLFEQLATTNAELLDHGNCLSHTNTNATFFFSFRLCSSLSLVAFSWHFEGILFDLYLKKSHVTCMRKVAQNITLRREHTKGLFWH